MILTFSRSETLFGSVAPITWGLFKASVDVVATSKLSDFLYVRLYPCHPTYKWLDCDIFSCDSGINFQWEMWHAIKFLFIMKEFLLFSFNFAIYHALILCNFLFYNFFINFVVLGQFRKDEIGFFAFVTRNPCSIENNAWKDCRK